MAIDWQLKDWELEETIFVCFYGGYFILNWLLWNTVVVKPMALISVFCHEMCHASACWMTCGKVKSIEVYGNEGAKKLGRPLLVFIIVHLREREFRYYCLTLLLFLLSHYLYYRWRCNLQWRLPMFDHSSWIRRRILLGGRICRLVWKSHRCDCCRRNYDSGVADLAAIFSQQNSRLFIPWLYYNHCRSHCH